MRVLPCTNSPVTVTNTATSSSGKQLVTRAMPGLHLIGDLFGCRSGAHLMTDATALEAFCKKAVADSTLTAVGSLFHSFGKDKGVTGTIMLAESHLALHTWPEDNYVTLDVYVCSYSRDNSASAEYLFETLMQAFQPADPHLHRVVRA
ncbi:adenosylmethionine decarboxylase [Betaproteobacteria bacterium PRO4]|uniref:adenosylmethionine decarboxylase n=1 Tax=Nitrosomonas sp. TaxID=42353 RepID=UPI00256E907F|nr:adenosylmethionine decarboxylase [Nitrosomonas sp.]MDL1867106.1 adenosylmethionine decarboxylase [Betaproteobacteria bacterium PRO4]